MIGKYSPTVSAAYDKDQDWFEKIAGDKMFDPDGYDIYGYNRDGIDRARVHELEYSGRDDDGDFYMMIEGAWGFDGTRPIPVADDAVVGIKEHCQNCKFWGDGNGTGYHYDAGNVNSCKHPLISGCQHPSSCSYDDRQISKVMVDGGGKSHDLWTRYNFGCNQFQWNRKV